MFMSVQSNNKNVLFIYPYGITTENVRTKFVGDGFPDVPKR